MDLDQHNAANFWLLKCTSRLSAVLGQISLRHITCPNLLSEWSVLNQMNSPESSLIVILQLSSMAEGTLLIISWFLLWRASLEHSSLSTDFQPSLNLQKPLLYLCTAQWLIPKSLVNHIVGFCAWVPMFLAKLYADTLLSFLGHSQCNTH